MSTNPSDKPTLLKELGKFVVENILTLVTMGVGLFFYIKSQPSAPPIDQSLGLIFGLLSTIVISDYITRLKYFRSFKKNLDTVVLSIQGSKSSFIDEIPFKEQILSSKKVSILTNTGHRSIGTSDEICEAFLKGGGEMKVIVMNPADNFKATEMAALRSTSNFGINYYKTRIENTLRELANAKFEANGVGQLTVKLCSFAPSFGIYMFERENNDCMIYIRIFAHFDSLNKSPNIAISKKSNPDQFNHYAKQFALVETRSIVVDLETYRN